MIAMDLRDLTADSFTGLVGQQFSCALEESGECLGKMVLLSVDQLSGSRPDGSAPFSLVFQAAPEIPATQQMLWLTSPGFGPLPIFLVPVGAADGMITFQAVFN